VLDRGFINPRLKTAAPFLLGWVFILTVDGRLGESDSARVALSPSSDGL